MDRQYRLLLGEILSGTQDEVLEMINHNLEEGVHGGYYSLFEMPINTAIEFIEDNYEFIEDFIS